MKRQVKCPCCRQPIDQNQMLVLFKLSKSIGRLPIKCRNAQQGCRTTFPLSNEYLHISNCPYEWQLCPHEGCGQQVLRKDAQAHDQSCIHWRQLCPMGCGTLLVRENQAQHNCYRDLHQRYVAERRKQRAIAANLRRKMQRMQSRMAQIRRQINLMCESLEVDDLEIEAGEGTSTWTDANIKEDILKNVSTVHTMKVNVVEKNKIKKIKKSSFVFCRLQNKENHTGLKT
ncbi:hypothetical protein PO909_012881 [Leuciscus waleckii]